MSCRGAEHGLSKLCEADVIEIREMYSAGVPQRVLAERFGIIQSNVSMIVNRKTWTHV